MEQAMSCDQSGGRKKFPSNCVWCIFEEGNEMTSEMMPKNFLSSNFFFTFSNFSTVFQVETNSYRLVYMDNNCL